MATVDPRRGGGPVQGRLGGAQGPQHGEKLQQRAAARQRPVDRLVRGASGAAAAPLGSSHEASLSNIAIGHAGVDVLMKVIPQLRAMQTEATKLAQMGTSIMSLTSEAVFALSQAVSAASAADTEAVVQNAI